MLVTQLTGKEEFAVVKELVDAEFDIEVDERGVADYIKLPNQTIIINHQSEVKSSILGFPKKYEYLLDLTNEGVIDLELSTDGSFEVAIMDSSKLNTIYKMAYIRSLHDDGEPANIVYSPAKGRGTINGKAFKLKGPNKRIFTLLFNNPNKPIDKQLVWQAGGEDGNLETKYDTIVLNTYITNLRRSLKNISPQQLRLKKTLELWAYTNLTDGNDLNYTK